MLKLNRVRLVNWHYFHDSVIDLDMTTLIAGDNGSGKSTIIDAIQYALIADIRKIKFNAAATEARTERTLESYCRCKIGATDLEYYRGDTITHIILEFSTAEMSFLAGVQVEVYLNADMKEKFWLLKQGKLEDIQVYSGQTMMLPRSFREKIKRQGGTLCATKKDYNNRLTQLLGVHRRNVSFNPYFEALIRSVSFTPLQSVDRFVCDYILEERQVDISAMKENLLNYKEAEREAVEMEEKISALEGVEELQGQADQLLKQIIKQEYLERQLPVDILTVKQRLNRDSHERDLQKQQRLLEHIEELKERHRRLQQRHDEMQLALSRNDNHRIYLQLSREKEQLEQAAAQQDGRIERHTTLHKQTEALLQRSIGEDLQEEIQQLGEEQNGELEAKLKGQRELEELERELADLKQEEQEVSRGILRYPESTNQLQRALKKQHIDAWVLADLLEVIRPEWQNAVEGWLNTQRFNILVEEHNFQKALSVYDSLPKEVSGVGLPNVGRMKQVEILPGSLAELVEASSPLARRCIAYLLGNVMMANLDTLKNHSRAVTRECMKYSGKTASRIHESVYSRWYIGKSAKAQRLAAIRKRIPELETLISRLKGQITKHEQRLEIIKRGMNAVYELKNLKDAFEKRERIAAELHEVLEQLKTIDTSEFEDMKNSLQSLKEQMDELQVEQDGQIRQSGRLESVIQQLEIEYETLKGELETAETSLKQFLDQHAELTGEFKEFHERHTSKSSSLDELEYKLSSMSSSKKGTQTKLNEANKLLRARKEQYNRRYNTYMTMDGDNSREFLDTLERFKRTELPLYREKIQRARQEAEQQFREHFVSRLNEYLTDARESFSELNAILKTMTFGQDQYSFTLQAKPEKRQLLKIIADAAAVHETEGTLFEQFTNEEQRRSIEQLFDSILENDLNSQEVREICDYRMYFTYDIKIKHTATIDAKSGRPLESSLSRSLREKSGGETQTPYYVAIAASFYRFFKDDEHAVRLVLFDEAFNKMDDDRIGNMLNFFRNMGIQVLTAVPTEKIETIAPYTDRINLILRKDYLAFIRDYRVLPEDGGRAEEDDGREDEDTGEKGLEKHSEKRNDKRGKKSSRGREEKYSVGSALSSSTDS